MCRFDTSTSSCSSSYHCSSWYGHFSSLNMIIFSVMKIIFMILVISWLRKEISISFILALQRFLTNICFFVNFTEVTNQIFCKLETKIFTCFNERSVYSLARMKEMITPTSIMNRKKALIVLSTFTFYVEILAQLIVFNNTIHILIIQCNILRAWKFPFLLFSFY